MWAAHWITRDTVLVRPPTGVTGITKVELYASPDASISNGVTGLQGVSSLVATTDGRYVVAASAAGNTLAVFARTTTATGLGTRGSTHD